jgi:putative membrane protein
MTERNEIDGEQAGGGATDDVRTNYAADRTVLANERTFAAWIRTGLTALAAGVAIEKLLVDLMAAWSIQLIALLLIVVSIVAFVIAAWRYTHLGLKLVHLDVKTVPPLLIMAISLLLVLCSLFALVDLWLTVLG